MLYALIINYCLYMTSNVLAIGDMGIAVGRSRTQTHGYYVCRCGRLQPTDRRRRGSTYRVLRERLVRISELVSAQGGRVVKFIGDAVFAEFASVVAAVICGTEIQAYLAETNRDLPEDRQIIFRIGINLGEVIIDGDDLFGDGVNVPAR